MPSVEMEAVGTDHCVVGEVLPIDRHIHRRLRLGALRWGLVGGGVLSLLYFGLVSLANSPGHALAEFLRLWYWMVPLIAGFSLQMGLFGYARGAMRLGEQGKANARGLAASGGASGLSMVACCAHHLTDILPFFGMAQAALFLTDYQSLFLLAGILSNTVGLIYLLGRMKRHGQYPLEGSLLSLTMRLPVERAMPATVTASLLVMVAVVGARLL